jgi:hypothetical protein
MPPIVGSARAPAHTSSSVAGADRKRGRAASRLVHIDRQFELRTASGDRTRTKARTRREGARDDEIDRQIESERMSRG